MREISKRLDATSGEGDTFFFKDDKSVSAKFVIDVTNGAPNSPIKIFEVRGERGINTFYKAVCGNPLTNEDWNGAVVYLLIKTNHEDDEFSLSGIEFSENSAKSSDVR